MQKSVSVDVLEVFSQWKSDITFLEILTFWFQTWTLSCFIFKLLKIVILSAYNLLIWFSPFRVFKKEGVM